MCSYCGCRAFPLVGQLSAEHEAIVNAAGLLARAVRTGGDPLAALDDLLALLMPHTATEENGLFTELRAEGSLADEVDQLCAEHNDIHAVLSRVNRDAPDWERVLAALYRLRRHIDREENGLFPAAVIALPFDAWDRITPTHADRCLDDRPGEVGVAAAELQPLYEDLCVVYGPQHEETQEVADVPARLELGKDR